MIIKSFGCSFVFGSELADDGKIGRYATGSQLTWPALIAQHYGYQYNTYARPGAGNLQILERLISHLADPINKNIFCVIAWTWIDRFDYYRGGLEWPGNYWKTLLPIDQSNPAQNYYKDLHSEFQDKLLSLIYISQAIDILKSKSIPFVMTYMDHLLFDNRWNVTPAVTELQNYVKPYMTTFEGLNFQEWSRQNNCLISEIGHPLEHAHQLAAHYIIKALDTKSIGVHCHLS